MIYLQLFAAVVFGAVLGMVIAALMAKASEHNRPAVDTLSEIDEWHRCAVPMPTRRDFDVQLGCHLEEIGEMLDALEITDSKFREDRKYVFGIRLMATGLKNGTSTATIANRQEFLDALADQIVTATGCGYRADMLVVDAAREVNNSNWSKFNEDGRPNFDENGKIVKGPNYFKPNLEGMY